MSGQEVLCLLGNGASIACSQEFRVDVLTTRLRSEPAFQALLDVHEKAGLASNPYEDFERIVGPWQRLASMLGLDDAEVREALSTLGFPEDLEQPLGEIARWMRGKYREGVAAVLREVVRLHPNRHAEVLVSLIDQLAAVAGNSRLSIFSLNYDLLLEQALLARDDRDKRQSWTDIFDGRPEAAAILEFNAAAVPARRVREPLVSFFESRRIHVAHLHGSVQWVEVNGELLKVELDKVRAHGLWEPERPGIGHLPVVILGDAKERDLRRQPFTSLYEEFSVRARQAELIVVVGYGGRDLHINRVLTDLRAGEDGRKRRIFVLGKADGPGYVWADFNRLTGDAEMGSSTVTHCSGRGLDGDWPEHLHRLLEAPTSD